MPAAPDAVVLRPEHLREQQIPGQVALRDGVVVYTLRVVRPDGERTELWTVGLDGGAAARLTESPGTDSCPRISPDGNHIAFLRAGTGVAQLAVLDLHDNSVQVLTDFPRGVHDLAWAPDGTWLVVAAEDAESPLVVRSPGVEGEQTCLVLHHSDWRRDGGDDRGLRLYPQHLHRISLDGAPPRRLTAGSWSATRPRVADDGSVYFLADTGVDPDLHPRPQVHHVDPATGHCHQVTAMPGGVLRYHVIDGGVRVLANANPEPLDHEPAQLFDVSGDGTPTRLLPDVDRWLGVLGGETDLFDWRIEADDAVALTTLSEDGSTVPVDVTTGRRLVTVPALCGAVADEGGRRVAVLALGEGMQAPDVYALDDAGPRRLTSHGAWLELFSPPRWSSITVPGPGGDITTHLLHPPRSRPGVPLATVLAVHGGPTEQWGVVPSTEALLLASAGYLVAMPNIRGSIDRGPSWVEALGGHWGDVDAADCLAVCDHLIATGLADAERLGVSGLSYGGFLTQWLVATTDRFAAAVAENGVANQVASWGSCDTGPTFNRSSGLGDPLTEAGAEWLWQLSPLSRADHIHTPLLMLQAADDRICPASDNEQLFVALRHLRRSVEYVIYPEESHLMQGTGRIDRRIDRHRRTVAWFDKYLAP